jgi:hypothetical protein
VREQRLSGFQILGDREPDAGAIFGR